MRVTQRVNSVLLMGASAVAMSAVSPALAQDTERKFETIVVTTEKREASIQDVPIAVSAFDEASLERLQLTGGPDLTRAIPNVTFTKSNFTGTNFKIRGIGSDLVAQSGDAGVGVHINGVPVTANRLFEAEFYDLERVEVLRGPQGTLYGRNATGGVVNIITAKPIPEFEAFAEGKFGNYNTFRGEGMINVPLNDMFAVRLAGAYLTRDGYADNVVLGSDIDGRDLFSVRATLGFEPTEKLRGYVSVEHFKEDDNRQRIGKQLCAKDPFETSFNGIAIDPADQIYTSLGCQEAPLSQSFDRVNSAGTLGGGLGIAAGLLSGDANPLPLNRNFREIESAIDPVYVADQTLYTAEISYDLYDDITLTYVGAFNETSIYSVEDYNKLSSSVPFNDLSGIPAGLDPTADLYNALFPGGFVTDPQLGTTNFLRTFDVSGDVTEQTSHELRLQSSSDGPFNWNIGAIYVDYEAVQPQDPTNGYYVMSNTLTGLTQFNNAIGGGLFGGVVPIDDPNGGPQGSVLANLDGTGGNYFRSLSPYRLESFALFGEGYFDVSDNLTITVGLRYTDDKKEQDVIPTFLFTPAAAIPGGDPLAPQPIVGASDADGGDGVLDAGFQEWTGRVGFDYTPDFSFSDDTLIYAFYSRGYKGGGINPPQPAGAQAFPQKFDPEFIDSYEIGTKNTLLNGALQLNATGFYYDYEGYQITQIINRTSANFNIDAEIKGLEFEWIWNPASTLVISGNLGLLDTEIKDAYAIDVLDRTNGRDDLVVLKNAVSYANCTVSAQAYATVLGLIAAGTPGFDPGATAGLCTGAFAGQGLEAAFGVGDVSFVDSEGNVQTVAGFTPIDGEAKNIGGNSIPFSPDTTLNIGAEYTFETVNDTGWNVVLRGDYYYQTETFSRVWNTPHDQLDSWDNLNIAVEFYNDQNGLAVELFGKNVLDEEAITGAYLTDDSSGLFTNIFLNEPQLYGISVSKRW